MISKSKTIMIKNNTEKVIKMLLDIASGEYKKKKLTVLISQISHLTQNIIVYKSISSRKAHVFNFPLFSHKYNIVKWLH